MDSIEKLEISIKSKYIASIRAFEVCISYIFTIFMFNVFLLFKLLSGPSFMIFI